ncbi:hypothetical protein GCM10022212_15490 [Actimicrobium antarcticum]|uniref:Uncharacterized protein n=2 Tax=Actimicrobium antarcticum TaxID=1051899 RepID=A0ABP7T4F6_9BURK
MVAFHLSVMATLWFCHEQILEWALQGPSDPRLRRRAVPVAHDVPDCGPGSCTERFVADGTYANAVSALVDTTLHHFVSANGAHLGPDPSVQMSYETPRYLHDAVGSARSGSGKIRLSIENVVKQARFISSGNADAALMQSVYHECTHALGSAAFVKSARRLGVKMVKADPYLRRSGNPQRNDVVMEALTAALENVPGITGRTYSSEWTGLMVDRRRRPVSWRQFGVHLVDQLGEATIKKAVFSNDAVAVRALEGYIDELIRTQPRKVLVLPVV